MLFKPETKELFSDNGLFIKKIYCQLNKKRSDLKVIDGSRNKLCTSCQNEIIETADYTDDQLIEIVSIYPNSCFMISPDQDNIEVIFSYEWL